MTPRRIITLVLLLVIIFVGALFTIQNGGRLTGLSLSFGFSGAAFQLAEPVPVPVLMWASLGTGLLLGGGWGLLQRFSLGRKIRELELKVKRADTSSGKDPWGS